MARLTASGALDKSFNNPVGYVKTFAVASGDQAEFNSVAVVPSGPSDAAVIMVGGSSQIGANASQLTVAAFKPGGSPIRGLQRLRRPSVPPAPRRYGHDDHHDG